MFENKVLKRIVGSKRKNVIKCGENLTMRKFVICTSCQILTGDHTKDGEIGYLVGLGEKLNACRTSVKKE
jgi:hypothetical protein